MFLHTICITDLELRWICTSINKLIESVEIRSIEFWSMLLSYKHEPCQWNKKRMILHDNSCKLM